MSNVPAASVSVTSASLPISSLRSSEISAAALGAILLLLLILLQFAPQTGVVAAEVTFPLMGAWILFSSSTDRLAPSVLFPAVFLLWFWVGNTPLLPEDRSAAATGHAVEQVWLYCVLGLISYLCGTLLLRGQATDATTLRESRGYWHDGLLMFFLMLLAICILLSWGSITASEGIPVLKENVDTFRLEVQERHRMAYQVMIGFSDLMLPLNFLYLWSAGKPKFRKTIYAFNLFIVFILISLGSRGIVLPSVLTVFALRHYLRKPWKTQFILMAGLALAALLSLSGYYRSIQHFGTSYAVDVTKLGIPAQLQPFSNIYLYVRAPIETFREVMRIIPTVVPFQRGSLSLGFILQLLPGRHPSSDYFFKDLLGHTFEGLGEPATILGTFYADYGALGIVVGMFITGLMTKLIYVHMFRGSLGWLLAYCFLWQKLIGGLYGSLFTYAIELLLPVVWVVSVWYLTGGTAPARGAVPTIMEKH